MSEAGAQVSGGSLSGAGGTSRSLVKKLSEVMGAVGHVPKTGRNNFHNYDYATEADIVAAVRSAMAERALMLVPSVQKTEWTTVERSKGGNKDRLCTLTVRFELHDGDSGEIMAFEVIGEGQDPGDKATYKALTGATKYALLKLFLIPTGDDPERDDDSAQKGGRQQQRGGSNEQQASNQQRQQQHRAPQQRPQGNQGQQQGHQGQQQRSGAGQPQQQPAQQGERRAPGPAPRDAREAASNTATQPATVDFRECVGFGSHKNLQRAEATESQLREALAEGEALLKQEHPHHFAEALRQAMKACEAEVTLRAKVLPTGAVVAFGAHKGKPVATLSVADINAAVALAGKHISENPHASWVPDARANVEVMLTELKGRKPVPQRSAN